MHKIAAALARHTASYRVVSGHVDIAREMCVRSDTGDANCDTSLGSAVQPPNVCQRGGPIVPHGTFRRGRRRGWYVNSAATRVGHVVTSDPGPTQAALVSTVACGHRGASNRGTGGCDIQDIVSSLCASQETGVDLIQHAQQVIGTMVHDDPTIDDAIDADARDRDRMARQRRPRA